MAINYIAPKVSICLPNLNTYPYLTERLDSILAQTFIDWELIIVDSYSDDGSWELFQKYAAQESRIRLFQSPREGIYAGFNACISRVRGEYVYIATSDDTMTPDCLEKMVEALDQNQDCGLCQCALLMINEFSEPLPLAEQWQSSASCQYLQSWLKYPHKRFAPHDGILHFAVNTVYTSVTQLLTKKSVFDTIGNFSTRWGAVADFEWEMRASLLYNTVYIPQILATWRIHPDQATTNPFTSINLAKLLGMAAEALSFAQRHGPQTLKHISFRSLAFRYQMARLLVGLNERHRLPQKLVYLWQCFLETPHIVLIYFLSKVIPKYRQKISDPISWIKVKINQLNIPDPIMLAAVCKSSVSQSHLKS